MADNADFERRLNALEARFNEKIIAETGRLQDMLVQDLIVHGIALRAMLAELDASQIERVKSRAVETAGTSSAKKKVAELLGAASSVEVGD